MRCYQCTGRLLCAGGGLIICRAQTKPAAAAVVPAPKANHGAACSCSASACCCCPGQQLHGCCAAIAAAYEVAAATGTAAGAAGFLAAECCCLRVAYMPSICTQSHNHKKQGAPDGLVGSGQGKHNKVVYFSEAALCGRTKQASTASTVSAPPCDCMHRAPVACSA